MSELPRPVTSRGEATRQKLLEAAEHEFGEKGFHAASISSITRRAGVGQGTFYLYFPSKEDAMRELVQHMGHALRRSLAEAIQEADHRLEIERKGFDAFVRFSLEHQNLYRVVMESQFVDEAVYRDYYQNLAEGYAAGLQKAERKGEIRPGDADARAWALMGIAHFLGLRYAIWEDREPPQDVKEQLFDFIEHGLAARKARA